MSLVSRQFIGFGASCQVSYQIRRRTRNEHALFFDWLIAHDLRSIDLILNHFDETQFLTEDCSLIGNGLRVLCPWSKLAFQHDFPSVNGVITEDFRASLHHVKEKYRFLRDRTLAAMAQDGSVHIRFEYESTDALAECARFREKVSPSAGRNALYVLASEAVAETMIVDDRMVFKLDAYQGEEICRWRGNDASWDRLFDRVDEYFKRPFPSHRPSVDRPDFE